MTRKSMYKKNKPAFNSRQKYLEKNKLGIERANFQNNLDGITLPREQLDEAIKIIGATLSNIRRKARISQPLLADKIEISPTTLSFRENIGERNTRTSPACFTIEEYLAICFMLKINPGQLINLSLKNKFWDDSSVIELKYTNKKKNNPTSEE